MQKHLYKLVFILFIVHSGCGPSKIDPKLQEAFEIHKQSLNIAKKTEAILSKIPSDDGNRLKLELELKEWNENLIEIPGFEHHHHSENCKHHHHRTQLELSPDHMLAIQNELQDSVNSIFQRVLKLDEVKLQ